MRVSVIVVDPNVTVNTLVVVVVVDVSTVVAVNNSVTVFDPKVTPVVTGTQVKAKGLCLYKMPFHIDMVSTKK